MKNHEQIQIEAPFHNELTDITEEYKFFDNLQSDVMTVKFPTQALCMFAIMNRDKARHVFRNDIEA